MAAGARVKQEGLDNDLLERIAADPAFNLKLDELDQMLDPSAYVGRSPEQVSEFLEELIRPLLEQEKNNLNISDELKV